MTSNKKSEYSYDINLSAVNKSMTDGGYEQPAAQSKSGAVNGIYSNAQTFNNGAT